MCNSEYSHPNTCRLKCLLVCHSPIWGHKSTLQYVRTLSLWNCCYVCTVCTLYTLLVLDSLRYSIIICTCYYMYMYNRYKGMLHSNIPLTGPLKVTGLSVTESGAGGNLIVSWSIPQSDLPITNYTVQYRTRVTEQWRSHSVSPPSHSTLLTGLDAGAGCILRVRAVSEIGDGAWSEEIMRCDGGECLWSMLC